jgi:hypothetical protein
VGSVHDLAVQPLRELPDQIGLQAANGFLTARTPEALLYCIEKLAADPQLAAEMASIGRAFALTSFSACRLVGEMSFLYHRLLVRGSLVAVAEQTDNSAAQTRDAI